MSSKAELQEQVELLKAELADANTAIQELKDEIRKKVRSAKEKAQKQSDKLEEERQKLYAEAKDVYTESLRVAKDIFRNYENQASENLGIVALHVREEVMHALTTVFGDELAK